MNSHQWNNKLNKKFVMAVIIGTAGADYLPGTAGDDSIVGLQGNDEIYGGSGDDWIYADDGNDYADGGWGRDRVYGNNGNDTLLGGGTASGLSNADTLYGGSGDDLYYHDFSLGGITVVDDLSGNEFNNFDFLYMVNATSLTVTWGDDRSTFYIYQSGELNDGSFDNGIMIRGMLTNLGNDGVGTIEGAAVNGSLVSGWGALAHSSWNSLFT